VATVLKRPSVSFATMPDLSRGIAGTASAQVFYQQNKAVLQPIYIRQN
jgi:hypothetical protein